MMFAAMLWLTPYYLAGFVRLPDGPWHVGVAMSVPEVLDGEIVRREPQPLGLFRTTTTSRFVRYALTRASLLLKRDISLRLRTLVYGFLVPHL